MSTLKYMMENQKPSKLIKTEQMANCVAAAARNKEKYGTHEFVDTNSPEDISQENCRCNF